MQRHSITEFCTRNNIQISREYADEGVSGSTTSRPMYELMLQDIRAGRVTSIYVWKLDRLSRSLSHLLDLLAEFRNRKITLVSVSDGLNTAEDNAMSRAFWALISVFANLERDLIVERVRAGLDRAKREGIQLGRRKGSTDKQKRSTSGYHLRYAGRSKAERRLGPRKPKIVY